MLWLGLDAQKMRDRTLMHLSGEGLPKTEMFGERPGRKKIVSKKNPIGIFTL